MLGFTCFDLIQLISLPPLIELIPIHASLLAPSIEPPKENFLARMKVPAHLTGVARQSVVVAMSEKLAPDPLGDHFVSLASAFPTPIFEPLDRFLESICRGFSFEDRFPLEALPPSKGEPKEVKLPLLFPPMELNDSGFVLR